MNCFKAARRAAGLTQMELSKRIHVSQGSISQWETGTTSPDIKTLILLADTYEITLDALLGRKSPNLPSATEITRLSEEIKPEHAEIMRKLTFLTSENVNFVSKQIDLLLTQQAMEKETFAG